MSALADYIVTAAAKRRECASCGEDQAELRLLDFNGWVPNEAWCGECFGTPEELEFKDLPLVQEAAK